MESDSLKVINILNQQDMDSHACGDMIWEVQYFLSRAWNISMHHIQRDFNVVTDQLAKTAIGGMLGYWPLSELLEYFLHVLEQDCTRVNFSVG